MGFDLQAKRIVESMDMPLWDVRRTLFSTTFLGEMHVAAAEHTAIVAAIRFLESATNTVIRDLTYVRLKQLVLGIIS
jgi:hypothetical protein